MTTSIENAKKIGTLINEGDNLNFNSYADKNFTEEDKQSPFPHFHYRMRITGSHKDDYQEILKAHNEAVELGFIDKDGQFLFDETDENLSEDILTFSQCFNS